MRNGKLGLLVGLILACTACSKKKADEGSGGGGGGGGAAAAGGAGGGGAAEAAGFETKDLEFGYGQFADGRDMIFKIKAQIPRGWRLMTEGDSLKMMNTFMPVAEGETPNLFNSSSLTIWPTCNGQCLAEKLPEQTAAMGKERMETHGEGTKMLQDEEVRPGVRAFVVEFGGTEKSDNVGVWHLLPGQDSAVFCEALLQGDETKMWEAIRDACLGMEIVSVDPLVGEERAAQELANLANCPASTTVKFTPAEAKPDEDPNFDTIAATRAEASQPGYVRMFLSTVAMTERDEFRDGELQPGQAVLELGLSYNGEGEILSGKYTGDGEGPVGISAGIRITGGTTLTVSMGADSWIEVVARTPDKICGRFELKDNWRTLTGEFTTAILPHR